MVGIGITGNSSLNGLKRDRKVEINSQPTRLRSTNHCSSVARRIKRILVDPKGTRRSPLSGMIEIDGLYREPIGRILALLYPLKSGWAGLPSDRPLSVEHGWK